MVMQVSMVRPELRRHSVANVIVGFARPVATVVHYVEAREQARRGRCGW